MTWEDVPWGKLIPVLTALAGVAGGVGGSDLYQRETREAQRAAWRAYGDRQAALVESYNALRVECQQQLETQQQREDELVERMLSCDCP